MDGSRQQAPESPGKEEKRRYTVSANRGKARHRIRYIEAGGAAVDTEECVFCEASPDLSKPEIRE
jgi:hypothetical protein